MKKLMTLITMFSLYIAVNAANVGICFGPKQCGLVYEQKSDISYKITQLLLAAIIYFPATGDPLIANQAKPYLETDPVNCVTNIMELIEHSTATKQKEVIIRGKNYRAQDILTSFLHQLKKILLTEFNDENQNQIVIAIPTNLSYNQREIVRAASFDAGLRPVRLVNMTTAAAIQYVNKAKTGTVPSTIHIADALHRTISGFKFAYGVLEEKEHKYNSNIDPKGKFDEIIFSTQDASNAESCRRIADGAAAYAAMIDKDVPCNMVCKVKAIMPYSLQLKTPKGIIRTIIAQNKPYPHTGAIIDYNITQPDTSLLIYQDKNESDIIGELSMPGDKAKAQILFNIDQNGILHAIETYKTNKDGEMQAASKSSRMFSQYGTGIKTLSLETERWKCLEYIKNTEEAYFANKEFQKKLWFWERGVIRLFGFSAFRNLAKAAKSIEEIQEINDKILEMRLNLGITEIE